MKRFLLAVSSLLISILTLFPLSNLAVKASVSSCSASISPASMPTVSTREFAILLTNTSSQNIVWIRVTRPSENYTLNAISTTDWPGSANGVSGTLSGNTLGPGSPLNVYINVTSGSSEAGAENWSVQVSDDGEGANPTACTGSLTTTISGVGDTTPPIISSISVANLSVASVRVNWTTNEAANSTVLYGETEEYGQEKTDGTLTSSHAVTLTGLSAETSYHYKVQSADLDGNSSESEDNTFTTAKEGQIIQPPPATATPKTPPPTVTVTTNLAKVFKATPKIAGKVTDQVAVSKIEYSLDDGRNWLPVDTAKNLGRKSATFEFTPIGLTDGNYLVKVRATNPSGNIGTSATLTLIVDQLPPRVGGNLISLGPQILNPDQNGVLTTVEGLDQRITLSATGGPTKIDLLMNSQTFSLAKDPETGLWSGVLSFTTPGLRPLVAQAEDGAGNVTSRDLNTILVLPKGQVRAAEDRAPINSATITVYSFESSAGPFDIAQGRPEWNRMGGRFVLWDAAPYRQENPQTVKEDGSYALFLPPGRYYLEVISPSYKKLQSLIFEVSENSPINTDFYLARKPILKIGGWEIPLPDLNPIQTVTVTPPSAGETVLSLLIGKSLPNFSLSLDETHLTHLSSLGKPAVLTFFSTWSPAAAEQMTALEDLGNLQKEVFAAAIGVQESASKLRIFKRRGGYQVPVVADPQGTLVEPLEIKTLPTHFFLDRRGTVQKIVVGFLSADELLDNLVH